MLNHRLGRFCSLQVVWGVEVAVWVKGKRPSKVAVVILRLVTRKTVHSTKKMISSNRKMEEKDIPQAQDASQRVLSPFYFPRFRVSRRCGPCALVTPVVVKENPTIFSRSIWPSCLGPFFSSSVILPSLEVLSVPSLWQLVARKKK